jgi:hypothetical protein
MKNFYRISFGLLLCILCLPTLFLGLRFAWIYFRILVTQPFYQVEAPYLAQAFIFVAAGAIGLFAASYAMIKREVSPLIFLASLAIVAWTAIHYPDTIPAHALAVNGEMLKVKSDLSKWGKVYGRFPSDEAELRAVLHESGLGTDSPSPYAYGFSRVPFSFVYIADATAPYLPQLPVERPALIYCAFNSERTHFWITATILEDSWGGPVISARALKGGVAVQSGDLGQP